MDQKEPFVVLFQPGDHIVIFLKALDGYEYRQEEHEDLLEQVRAAVKEACLGSVEVRVLCTDGLELTGIISVGSDD